MPVTSAIIRPTTMGRHTLNRICLSLRGVGGFTTTGSKGLPASPRGASVCAGSPLEEPEEEPREEPGVAVTLAFLAVCSPSALGEVSMQSEEPRRKGSSQRRMRGSAPCAFILPCAFSLPSLAAGRFSIQRMPELSA